MSGVGSALGAVVGTIIAPGVGTTIGAALGRSEEHTSELQSLREISYAVFCLKNHEMIILINLFVALI